ncbi:uncharacterized protein LOC128555381 [Mercenaria mercenaria]|uniref:uncharacterized protein LOC128555381 n=1 Tax=Mercenaria mercenaria TaxID=6596 RepID=UPI00234E4F69|nr:uncharacterized protein LOC128555381 [Mercenaria mercenaria]
MGSKVHVIVIISVVLLLALNGSEGRRRTPKPVGKCLNKKGELKCNSKQICMTKNELCVPYDMSKQCRCKKNKVRGCEDSVGQSVCKYGEECLEKKSGKPCSNHRSRECKCTKPKDSGTGGGAGCFVGVDKIKIFIPIDGKFHPIKGKPCTECMCRPKFPDNEDFCVQKSGCNAGLQLFVVG